MIWETERLLLRPFILADLDDLYHLYRQPIVMQYVSTDGTPRSYQQTSERLQEFLADFEHYGFGLYATCLKTTGALIGRCGLKPVQGLQGLEGDIQWLFEPAYWGQGLATEFARAMIPYGFAHFPLTRIFATADQRNPASIRVMQKANMTLVHSDERDVEYEILRSSFEGANIAVNEREG